MKNKIQTTTSTIRRRPRRFAISQPRPAFPQTPSAPQHDLLVLGFYPGMNRTSGNTGHPHAA